MTTPSIREVLAPASVAAGSQTLNTGSGTAVGDLLVLGHGYDYYTLADLLTPTGTAGTWTQQASADGGSNRFHWKIWTRPVTSGGAQTVTVNTTPTDASQMPVLFVLDGSTLTLAVDGAAGGNGAASTTHDSPSVSPSGSDDLLICFAGTSPDQATNYTVPSGMTSRSEVDVATNSTAASATQVLSASGATGAKSWFSTASQIWAAASIAISGTAGAAASPPPRIVVAPSMAAIQSSSW